MRPARACSLVVLVLGLCSAGVASAYERQWHVGPDFGYAYAPFPAAGGTSGFGGGAHLAYGLNDAFNLRVNSDVLAFSVGEPPPEGQAPPPEGIGHHWATVWTTTVGAEYVLDIVAWVPYFGIALGFADVIQPSHDKRGEERRHDPELAFEIPFGISYLPTQDVAFGIEGRYRLLALGAAVDSPVQMFLAQARVEYVWGY